jgi:sulfur-carrier protein adenylyltransferase/sulfurtransferase
MVKPETVMTVLYETAAQNAGGYRDVDPVRVAEARARVRVVDVREPHELAGELGHIPGAELVPLGTVETAARAWDREQEIVLVCRSGNRSGRAAAALTAMGFHRAMNLVGGMLAWNEAKLPTRR